MTALINIDSSISLIDRLPELDPLTKGKMLSAIDYYEGTSFGSEPTRNGQLRSIKWLKARKPELFELLNSERKKLFEKGIEEFDLASLRLGRKGLGLLEDILDGKAAEHAENPLSLKAITKAIDVAQKTSSAKRSDPTTLESTSVMANPANAPRLDMPKPSLDNSIPSKK